ncbi:MAG: hypothetical protein JWO38_4022, partial [Gemmataceae bacterium]|nr:hypothetical protein [Gemmataceae bacterium]
PGSVVLVENHLRAECHWKGVILAETWDQGRGRIPMFPGRILHDVFASYW